MGAYLAGIPYTVPYADTDQMKVVYYANFLVYFERARTAGLRELGYPYSKMEADGFQLPIIEAHVEYAKPAHYEDELLLECRFKTLGAVRVKAECRVRRDADVLAEGYTIHVCYDPDRGRPVRLPAILTETAE